MSRSENLEDYLANLKKDLPSFEEADFSDLNWQNHEGENALHIAVIRDDVGIVRELIANGIELNARGDLGYTPLHEAASRGNFEIVKLLVESGADVHALSEGDPPFTVARYSKNDVVCDYLGKAMKSVQSKDRSVWAKAKIKHLEREIARIKNQYGIENA